MQRIALNIYRDVCLEEYEQGIKRKPIQQFYINKDDLILCIMKIKESGFGVMFMNNINTLQDFLENEDFELNKMIFGIAQQRKYKIDLIEIDDVEL